MRYRKKPIVIEAAQYVPDEHVVDMWVLGGFAKGLLSVGGGGVIFVKTKEGTMELHPYDYLIKGVEGELYPCKRRIFEKTYEEV